MQNTDLLILDLKEIDPVRHKALTGHDNANILALARYAAQKGVPLWVRHVLVPGLTDDADGLRELDAFIRTLPTVRRVEILPYHTLGPFKWQNLGIDYPLQDACKTALRKKHAPLNFSVPLPDVDGTDTRPGPEEQLLTSEACADALHKVRTELSDTERRVLLASVHGLSPAQTARTMGTSPKSVANALARARRKLRGT